MAFGKSGAPPFGKGKPGKDPKRPPTRSPMRGGR